MDILATAHAAKDMIDSARELDKAGGPRLTVHFIGHIEGASGFDESNLFLKWSVAAKSANWRHEQGQQSGVTHTDYPEAFDGNTDVTWSHPLDLCYSCEGIQGWPVLNCEVWTRDAFGRAMIVSYGTCTLPDSPGMFELKFHTWRPVGTLRDQALAFFLGTPVSIGPTVKIDDHEQRGVVGKTVGKGTVHLKIGVLFKGLDKCPKVFYH